MAELNVQPKSKRPGWLWLLLILLALALLFFLFRSCNRDQNTTPADTDAAAADSTAMTGDTTSVFDWNTVDFGAPAATYDEITDADITVRGNDDYAIYSLDETILFDTDKNTIKPSAAEKLKQVSASMGKRFANGEVRIYGHTDAKGGAGYNMQLAEQRAEAVKNWLTQNGNLTGDRISLHPVGEAQPVASNATAEGRQQNRRVEIVVRRGA
ncbi:OmpA family protein [Adhaeribacter radiodurans]|uniref:OmpA family protein n=1 Tax=Adhaeribacter radiodurans TaxID=2745197 RepID=A0A7L7LAC0_9BACT|nr:OmpA family protein [Adhaeribacter radiodurans]QMU29495.1 OmpA family protein [Adhaeribacter radiodurans]